MAVVEFKNINKIYNNKVQAVFDFNLTVQDKEFVALVGPSGCGKSTTLRMLAGLEDITDGDILIDGKVVNDALPKDRDIAMVFQSYALYPHMSVFDNMAFGLKIRRTPKPEIVERVNKAAEILGLTDYLKRKPKELSGGQRQRVALGRAIVRTPKVFLMDEPLSNLDAKLRVQMRSEITKIHQTVGATTVYVTHDQTEAMTMADRIVVMKDGWIQQIGTPSEVYNYPANMFVAGFIGTPPTNFIKGTFDGTNFIVAGQSNFKIELPKEHTKMLADYKNKEIVFGVRPENVTPTAKSEIKGKADVVELLGYELIVYTYLDDQRIIVKADADQKIKVNDEVCLEFDFTHVHYFDPETTNRINK